MTIGKTIVGEFFYSLGQFAYILGLLPVDNYFYGRLLMSNINNFSAKGNGNFPFILYGSKNTCMTSS